MPERRTAIAGAFVAAAIAAGTAAVLVGPGEPLEVKGRVTGPDGAPVAGAVVRIATTDHSTRSDADGRFSIAIPVPGEAVRLTAWAEGSYIVGGTEHRGGEYVEFTPLPLPDGDNPDYQWKSFAADPNLFLTRAPLDLSTLDPECFILSEPVSRRLEIDPACLEAAVGEDQGCSGCHSRASVGGDVDLPVDQWLQDAHASSAVNPRFLTMFLGTDVNGNASPPTRLVDNRDYGEVPLGPDPSLPYFGPGYRLDFPDSNGNCAACHTPAAAIDDPYGTDPSTVTGVGAEGVGCDFCHKVWDVHLDESTGLPDDNRPGVLSYEFRRPPNGHQFFAGPYDDVAPGEDTYVPLYSESAYCAPCHRAVFWDTLVYDSYGEWLDSPYADPASGATCQDCHMPPTGATHFADPATGGLERDPGTIPGHRMPGASDLGLLQNSVSLTAEAAIEGGDLVVSVEIVNDQTGHHVPTDSPLRHMILLVEAAGPGGALALVDGAVLPEWTGVGDPGQGRYAGLPGTAYAKVLEELWTEVYPTGAYWNQTRIRSDNRIPALGSDTTVYRFGDPGGPAEIEVTLLFRRAFIDLADQKGWDLDDIVMEQVVVTVPGG